jgi:EAL domain-containing protein (putative c-di-GMP-specific phosphodiesterase class I)
LKVDKSFVSEIGSKRDDEILAHAIIDLTHTLGLEAVAEGVERKGQGERLQELGCKYGQGYLYSKPLTSDELEVLIRATLPGTAEMPKQVVLA